MKKLLMSLTLATGVLLTGSTFAALQNCERPTDGNWDSYCSCFLEQGMKACDSCSATVCRPKTKEAVEYNIMHRLNSDSDIERACGSQVSANVDNSCLAPDVDQTGCIDNIKTFKEHCG